MDRTSVFAAFARPFVLLEDRLDPGAGARLYRGAVEVVRCDDPAGLAEAFARLDAGLGCGLHAAGFLAYELGYLLEPKLAPLLPASRAAPLVWMGLFPPPSRIAPADLDAAFAALAPPPPLAGLGADHDRAAHVAKTRRVLELIRAGDLYQANLTFQLRFRVAGDPLALYAVLRSRQPVAHGGVVAMEQGCVLSVSPELFVEVRGGLATSRPMKGTAARGATPALDDAARAALAADAKQRAENLMIVDLIRNDLARISRPGTVRAGPLFAVETYPTFHALTSTVAGSLASDADLRTRLAALFPCGSVVGAPKIRAAEVIRELEAAPRGVYTGAVGAIEPNGDMAFNVAIRTATVDAGGAGLYGVGGGVVADSDPDAEYDEALLKGRVLSDLAEDYGLIETFRWSPASGFVRLDDHLRRLAASASALGFVFDPATAQAALAGAVAAWSGAGQNRRVRLQLARNGELALTSQPAPAASPAPLRLCIADARLDPGDPFLRHKTTRREAFERAFAFAAEQGCDEALLLNRRGEVADASRHSVFVEHGGGLLTPPLGAGALPGVLRAALLAEGRAVEAVLRPEHLPQARWFVGNSLHGLRPAALVG